MRVTSVDSEDEIGNWAHLSGCLDRGCYPTRGKITEEEKGDHSFETTKSAAKVELHDMAT